MIRMIKGLYIQDTPDKGRGVFCLLPIIAGTMIEISPVLVMSGADRKLLDQTSLKDYIFEWGQDLQQCVTAWGYLSMYNHSYSSNAEYYMDFEQQIMTIIAVRDIAVGEEITINYNGDWDDEKKLWFDAI